ncbi:hypothetical protein BpHYR1_015552 [Brachionus plicatilis]|uniref:Uncharacterized protein n=1 Tax=Brachionus plicatilis TaxID=10195 RepID=A0A3M7QGD1_BRAPC|nr:hypothetical protein BpHYR1_015552 [Brachionus plicatilis]
MQSFCRASSNIQHRELIKYHSKSFEYLDLFDIDLMTFKHNSFYRNIKDVELPLNITHGRARNLNFKFTC